MKGKKILVIAIMLMVSLSGIIMFSAHAVPRVKTPWGTGFPAHAGAGTVTELHTCARAHGTTGHIVRFRMQMVTKSLVIIKIVYLPNG